MANNFSGDSSCKALWRFESGALGTDSKGANTLTPQNSPSEDTADYKEGACAVSLLNTSSQYLNITDANLDSGFPFKSGDANKLISCAFFVRGVYGTSNRHIISKWNENSKRSWTLAVTSSGVLRFLYSTNGTSLTYKDMATLAANTWYHIGVAIDGPNKKLYAQVKNISTGVTSYYTIGIDTPYVSDADLAVGCVFDSSGNPKEFFYGKIDELVIFNRLANWIEFDKISAGNYSAESQLDALAVHAVVDYQEESETKVSQVLATVEWVPTDPNTHVYAGNIGITITPQGSYDPVWAKTGSVPIAMSVPGEYFYIPPGEFEYHGSIGLSITPDADYLRTFAFRSAGIGLSISPQAQYLFPDYFYESPGISVTIVPAAAYRIPVIGWDTPSGYGCVDFTDLQDPPPFWCIDTDGITLALDNTAEKFELYAEYAFGTEGGVLVDGALNPEVVEPGVTVVDLSFGVKVGGSCDIKVPEPWITTVTTQGGVLVQGWLDISFVTPVSSLITEITTRGGVVVGGAGDYSYTDPADLVTEITTSGGVVVGGRRYPPIEFIDVDATEVYYEFDVQGGVRVGGELEIDTPEPGVYEFSIRRGGVVVGGACTFGFAQPPVTEFDIRGGVFVEGSIVEDVELYETYTLTGQGFQPSLYSNFLFNSYAERNGQILAARSDGIYALEGDDDAGREIHPGVRLGPTNFGVDNIKGVRAIYPGDCGDQAEVRVSGPTKNQEVFCALDRGRFSVGQEVLDRLLVVEISDFEQLSHVEIIPRVKVKGRG